jgi:hypothetical protein
MAEVTYDELQARSKEAQVKLQWELREARERNRLRDEFAGLAMQPLARAWVTQEVDDYLGEEIARDAYDIAEFMLAERDKRRKEARDSDVAKNWSEKQTVT